MLTLWNSASAARKPGAVLSSRKLNLPPGSPIENCPTRLSGSVPTKSKPHGGMITQSIAAIGVREGNPKQIKDWTDLTKPGVEVLIPNPSTSGGAKWDINGVYGAGLKMSEAAGQKDPEKAKELVAQIYKNVKVLDNIIVDQIADGLNFHTGVTGSVVRNNFVRNTGDDALAMWAEKATNSGNVFDRNTVQTPTLANGIAIYGGHDITVSGNLVADPIREGKTPAEPHR